MAHLLSKKVITRLQMIQDSAATKSQAAAAEGARLYLEHKAANNVCLSCHKAQWFVRWHAEKATNPKEWDFVLSACGAGISLVPNEGLGLHVPDVPFCTAKDDDAVLGGISRPRPLLPPAKSGPVASNVHMPRQRGG